LASWCPEGKLKGKLKAEGKKKLTATSSLGKNVKVKRNFARKERDPDIERKKCLL